jgi:hypothetical protein
VATWKEGAARTRAIDRIREFLFAHGAG